nr:hypothetical protein [candidate division Zixibacteria bacterium]
MRRNSLTASAALLLVFLFGLAADSGAQMFGPGMGEGRGKDFGKRSEMFEKNLENLRILKLLELLELNDEQNTRFIARYAQLRSEMKAHMDRVEAAVDALSDLLKTENPSEKDITAMVDEIDRLRGEMNDPIIKFHKDISSILTAVQTGKMVVFESRFERELIESVRGFREKMMPSSNP